MLRRLALGVLVGFVLLLLAPASAPVEVSYVTSGSMAPTLQPYDGYVLVSAGPVEPGEIVTFYSDARNEYVTHRVVRETSEGFITKGDANPSTDQAAGHPPVPRAAIVGEVLSVAGHPVVMPGLGRAVQFGKSHRLLLIGALVLALLPLGGGRRARPQRLHRAGEVLFPILLGAALASGGIVLASATHPSVTYSVTAAPDDTNATLTAGEPAVRSPTVRTRYVPFQTLVYTADGGTALDRTGFISERTGEPATQLYEQARYQIRVRMQPTAPGRHRVTLHVYAYPAVLPRSVLTHLHAIHPALATGVSVVVAFVPLTALSVIAIDPRLPVRVRTRWLSQYLDR